MTGRNLVWLIGVMAVGVFALYLSGSTYWALIQDTIPGPKLGSVGGCVHSIANCAGIVGPRGVHTARAGGLRRRHRQGAPAAPLGAARGCPRRDRADDAVDARGRARRVKLSICIPTYNRAEFLPATLESIAAQWTDEIEIAVSDNASTDHTAAIVESYRERLGRVRWFRAESNRGADANYLKAVEISTGEYCWILGSDDPIAPGAIAELLDAPAPDDGAWCRRLAARVDSFVRSPGDAAFVSRAARSSRWSAGISRTVSSADRYPGDGEEDNRPGVWAVHPARSRTSAPNTAKLARQPRRPMRNSATGAESIPPKREPKNSTPLATPRGMC